MASPALLLHHLVDQLHDPASPLVADLAACGIDAVTRLQKASLALIDPSSRSQATSVLDELIALAHKRMAEQRLNFCWRRLYTDACILRSLADVMSLNPRNDQNAKLCVSRLDRSLIVAGAPGEGRYDLLLDLIAKLQSDYLPSSPFDLSAAQTRFLVTSSHPSPVASSSMPIPRLSAPPSLSHFQRHLFQNPFILPGSALDWPAMTEHPWHSPDYLRSVGGRGRIVPVEIGSDYRTEDWSQEMMDWDEFLDSLESSRAPDRVLYLAQHSLFTQFPALRADIVVPDYVYTCPSAPANYTGYQPPGNEDQLVINAWLGPKGTTSPAHTDPFFNCYAQVVGRKTVWLAPPEATPFMYPYPDSTADVDKRAHNPAANTLEPSMSNTSRVDVFATPDANYPLFWEHAVPRAMSATLEPGDVLFFPPGWWHALRSEDVSFSVSMWF
ncbi:Clavaminate synthase-like protein [Dentipellis sp. KUC8613]|nr:Clavaminate synthase-like protein [Dentipellis sp. KUC8613]